MGEIVVEGIVISVIRKPIKGLYLRVLPPDGKTCVSAPAFMSDETIRQFTFSKLDWIKEQRERCMAKKALAVKEYVTGEECFVWGKKHKLYVQEAETGCKVSVSEDKLVLQIHRESAKGQREKVVNEWYRSQMKQRMPEILQKCEEMTGIHVKEWRVKYMRTRWGTCNIDKKRIWLNLQLAKLPPECLEYVVIHELTHLLERKHNRRFYGFLYEFCPDFKEREKMMEGAVGR